MACFPCDFHPPAITLNLIYSHSTSDEDSASSANVKNFAIIRCDVQMDYSYYGLLVHHHLKKTALFIY